MSGVQCNRCGSSNIEDAPGGVVCTDCGNVLEQGNIVSEPLFVQDSGGVSRPVGQFINTGDDNAYGSGKSSRAVTMENAKQNIQAVASRLNLKPNTIASAFKYYRMALLKHITKGRKSSHVIAACVYIACRQDNTPHMMLDLSDVLKINVYELGRTYLKLIELLKLSMPVLDPVIYISRFANQLQFGDKIKEVVATASKLAARMKSDWIHFGRRPSGLCGAALLVAARIHNFHRTVDDIIKVVKVCQATLRKRLNEFVDTPSGNLSVTEFFAVDLSEQQDPPAFKNARKKMREEAQLEEKMNMEQFGNEVLDYQKIIEKAMEKGKKGKYSKYSEPIADNDDVVSDESFNNIHRVIAENTAESLGGVETVDAENLLSVFSKDAESAASDSEYSGTRNYSRNLAFTLETLGFGNSTECPQDFDYTNTDPENKLCLDGIDDSELEMYFVPPLECKIKDETWHQCNADFLEELKARAEKRALEEEQNARKPKKRKAYKSRNNVPPATVGEAICKVIQQKKMSSKLNYDILSSLNTNNPSDVPKISVEMEPEKSPSLKSFRMRPVRPKMFSTVPASIKQKMSDIVGRNKKLTLEVPAEEKNEEGPLSPVVKVDENAVVMENQPLKEEPENALNNTEDNEAEVVEFSEDEEEDSEDEYGFPKEDGPPDYYECDEFQEPIY